MYIKSTTFILIILMVFGCKTTYNLGQCEQLFLDFEKGTLNGVLGTATMDKAKKAFPCFTGETKEGSDYNCGGGVYFLKHDFYFYTHRDFIEVRKGYTGKMSKPVLGLNEEELISLLGKPDETLKHKGMFMDEEIHVYQYSKKWGTLSFIKEEGKITEIYMHHGEKPKVIDYCF